ATGCRQPVEPPAPLSSRLYPAARDPAFALQPVQDGIQGGRQKTDGAARSALDLAGDLVAVPVAPFELGEHEKFGATVFASAISGRFHRCHIFLCNISQRKYYCQGVAVLCHGKMRSSALGQVESSVLQGVAGSELNCRCRHKTRTG